MQPAAGEGPAPPLRTTPAPGQIFEIMVKPGATAGANTTAPLADEAPVLTVAEAGHDCIRASPTVLIVTLVEQVEVLPLPRSVATKTTVVSPTGKPAAGAPLSLTSWPFEVA